MLRAKCDGKETGFLYKIVKVEIEHSGLKYNESCVFNLRLKMITLGLVWDKRLAFYCVVLTFAYLISL